MRLRFNRNNVGITTQRGLLGRLKVEPLDDKLPLPYGEILTPAALKRALADGLIMSNKTEDEERINIGTINSSSLSVDWLHFERLMWTTVKTALIPIGGVIGYICTRPPWYVDSMGLIQHYPFAAAMAFITLIGGVMTLRVQLEMIGLLTDNR